MERMNQFVPLSEKELFSTNGGGLFDSLLDSLAGGHSYSSVNYTGLTSFMGQSYLTTNRGFADYLSNLGQGTNFFLANLRYPTS
ncbi:hypothetical protein [Chitinophaga polysaccharea]|uniref:hypothetical protein n=1 Tax=Chitinophaga polysaccharea TaxID=1293035 RepID=UPI00115A9EFD|nr:hypothetical protein [Chitinophaga polysaccharea]